VLRPAKVELSLALADALAHEVGCSFANVSTTLTAGSIDEAITSFAAVFALGWSSVEYVASQESILFASVVVIVHVVVHVV